MPRSRQALQELLRIVDAELANVEAKLLGPLSVSEASSTVDMVARLRLQRNELLESLMDGGSDNESSSALKRHR